MTAWLTIVGIGEDGVFGLGLAARQAISEAGVVFGGKRHLALAETLITGRAEPWLNPFEKSVEAVVARRGQGTCVLASGDPFLHGVGATLSRVVPAAEMRVFPAPSAFSLAAARLAWPLQETTCLSLHGRPIDLIRPQLFEGARILALTSDGGAPAGIAALLTELGFGPSIMTVLEALGGPEERIRPAVAETFDMPDIHPLNVCALALRAAPHARVLPLTSGLDDALFAHDGQISKREVRALALSALTPRRGERLWDIGAGSGSIAVEWMLADSSLSAIAIEADAGRAARIAENARAFGVPDLAIVTGAAPAALAGLPVPDAIFVGGGGSDQGVMDAALLALRPGGRMVANAVTTEMERLLLDLHAVHGGSLTRIEIARAAPIGTMTGWRPAMPITQWAWIKPETMR